MGKARTRFWRQQIMRYGMIAIGGILSGISINAFLLPHQLLSGGVAGAAMILHFLLGWPVGAMVAVFNIPLFVAAYKLKDRAYFFSTLYGMLVFTLSIDATQFMAGMNLLDDTMLAAILGGVISGVGAGLVFRVDGSLGGTDIIAVLIKKYYAFNISYVGFAINCVIMTIAAFLFGFKLAMFTLLSMYVSAIVTDRVIEGFNTKKTIFLISERYEELADAIIQEMGRGVTFLDGQGAFTRENRKEIGRAHV